MALRLALLPLALLSLCGGTAHAARPPPAATALPTGGQVVAGQAQVQQTSSAALTIEQTSTRAAIDWQSFNIGAAASVNFVQPSSQSVTLNRVLSSDPSQIFGKLTANGQVFLSNPGGVIFGSSASVDVGALVATTSGISTVDFMAGRSTFTRDGATGSVRNRGRLSSAAGGYIALLAPEVRNAGVIVAQAGTVAMAGGEAITLNFAPDSGLASIAVTPAQIKTLIQNRRAIVAEDGQIILAARSVEGLQSSVVNSGTLDATSLVSKGGRVVLEGDDITLANTSDIGAQGATGGGTVLIGGGDVAPATTVTMAPGALIDASATAQGDGGTVLLWSDVQNKAANTKVQGTILARGGAQGGNGGQIETSGAHLQFDGARIDTSAAQGATGHWLLDPFDLTVDATNAATISSNLAGSNITLQTTASGSSGPGIANASGNGDITIASAISWSSANTLTLDAYRSILINAPITASNAGKVVLKTNDGGSGGDYSFGLGTSGFGGRLSFGSSVGTAALTINGSAYTLIYDLTAGANGLKSLNGASSGNYALANSLSATSLGTVTSAVVGTFGNIFVHTPTLTGLGNSVTGLTMNVSGAKDGLFGENYAVVRDIGVTGASIANVGASNSGNSVTNVGLLAGNNTGGTIKNSYSTGTIVLTSSSSANSPVGGLVGLSSGTIDSSWSSAALTVQGSNVGGLVGQMSGGAVSNSYATGAVSANGSSIGGLAGSGVLGATVTNSYATGSVSGTGANSITLGGLVGDLTGSISTSYASGNVSGYAYAGGLVGGTHLGTSITDAYATGNVSVSSGTYAGGLAGYVGALTTITNVYASGSIPTASAANRVGALIGEGALTTLTYGYWNSTVAGTSGFGSTPGIITGGGSMTTAQLQGGTYPYGFSPSKWGVLAGISPYLLGVGQPAVTANYQLINGTSYTTGGSTTANSSTVNLYVGGSLMGTAVANGAGVYAFNVPVGTITASTPVAETMGLNAAPTTVVAASYADTRTLTANNLLGADITQGLYPLLTTLGTDSALQSQLASTYGSTVNTSVNSALASASKQLKATGAFTIDDALTGGGGLSVQAVGDLTLASGGSATSSGGNVSLSSTAGNLNINTSATFATANTLTYDAFGNVTINAPVTVSGAGKVVIVSGDTANNGTGTAAGDYSFGLTANGFSGALNFTNAAGGGQTLNINNSAYTLLYTQANVTGIGTGFGKYALANSLDLSAAGTFSSSLITSFGTGAVFTGLGHTINGMTISGSGQFMGLVSTNNGIVRDIGVTNGSVTTTNTSARASLVAAQNSKTLLNVYATGSVTALSQSSGLLGLLTAQNNVGTVSNSWATGTITTSGTTVQAGGLVGSNSGGTISNTLANVTIKSTATAGSLGGLVGDSSSGSPSISNSYAMGAVNGAGTSDKVGGLIGNVSSGTTVSSSYATGYVNETGTGSSSGGAIGANAGTVTNVYYDAGTTGKSDSGKGTGQTTAQLQSGSLPTGLSSSNWTATSGQYPYLTQFFPNGMQSVSGLAYQANGSLAAGAAVSLYAGGSAISTVGSVQTGANGYYYAVAPTGLLPAAAVTALGGTMTLSGAGSISAASYAAPPTLASGSVTGFNFKTNTFSVATNATTSSSFAPNYAATFGSGVYANISTLANAGTTAINPSGAFTINSAMSATGSLSVQSAGTLTLASGGSATSTNGNVLLGTTVGDVVLNTAVNYAGSNTLSYDAAANVIFNAPVTVSGAGKVVIVSGDVGNNGTGTAAGDYNFGLTANGFGGAMSFTNAPGGGQTLNINNSAYTLLYSQANLTGISGGTGKYALANSLDLSGAGTLSAPVIATLGAAGVFTGLGHTVNNLTINDSTSSAVGLIGTSSGMVRDLGAVGGSVTASAAGAVAGELIGSLGGASGGGRYLYATGNVSLGGTANQAGGLIGRINAAVTLSNAFSTGAVTSTSSAASNALGGLVGSLSSSATLSNVFATGAVTAGAGSGTGLRLGGLVGNAGTFTLSNAFAFGAVSDNSNAAATNLGGLIGAASSGTVSNVLAIGAISGSTSASGGLLGSATGITLSNGYYDASTTGQSDSGKGTGRTTAQLQAASLPSGFSSSAWSAGSGLYPYLTPFFPNGVQAITGTAYQSNGTAAKNASVALYANGAGLTTLGAVASGANGYYYAITPTGTLPVAANTRLAGTLALNGAALTGASYSDLLGSGAAGISGLDLKAGLFEINTSRSTASALNSDLTSAFGAGNYTVTSTATDTGRRQINSSGAFTLDAALGQTGSVGFNAAGDLAINAALSTGTAILQSSGNVSDGSGGSISATNLALLGGNVVLDNSANAVGTLAASGVSGLTYAQTGALNLGSVGPINLGVSASNINGTGSSTIAGVSATGLINIATLSGNLTVAQNIATSNASTSAITLNAGQSAAAGTATGGNLIIGGSPAISTGAGGRATLYSGSASADASLATLIGLGSGRFRYDSDEGASNYTAALGTGLYGVYRQLINTAIVVNGQSVVYGTAPAAFTSTNNLVNGDSATLTASGIVLSSSGSTAVGSYTISAGNLSTLLTLGYTSAGNSNGAYTVTPKFVTVNGVVGVNKVYDGGTSATGNISGASISGLVGGDVVSVASASGSFGDKNVGTAKSITLVDTLSGTDAGNYSVASTITTANITPKGLSVSGITAANKVYDSSTSATVSTAGASLNGLVNGDNVTLSATGVFGDKNVGTGKTVSLTDIFGGTDVGNYTITGQASTTADITPKALIVSGIGASNKVYDGTTTANLITSGAVLSGLIGGDAVSLSSVTGSYADKNAGLNKTITLSSSYSGADVGNYAITSEASTIADITRASLSLSSGTLSKVYDGTTNASGTPVIVGGTLFGGDSLSGGSFSYDSKNVGIGDKVVSLSGVNLNDGNGGGNYLLSYVNNTNSSITAKALSISGITVADKVYDGTTVATINASSAVLSGLVSGDVVTVSATGAFGDKNVGAGKTILLSDTFSGSDASNYTITGQSSTAASITPKTLTVSQLAVADRTYDGTATATVLTGGAQYAGLVVGDSFALTSATGSFADKNVGIAKTVSISSSYSGADAGNYNVVSQTSTTASIAAAPLTVSTIDVSKVYDGTTTVFGGQAVVLSGALFGGDTLTGGTFAYTSKNVGLGNKVVVDVLTATLNDGNSGHNYAVSYVDNVNSTITPKALSVSGVTAADKVYDGTSSATVSTGGASLNGLVGGDNVTLSVTGAFANKNVGVGKTVSLTDIFGGADAGNYTITGQSSTTASITPKTLTVSQLAVADRTYDGTAIATVLTGGAQYAGLVVGDSFTIASATGSFANKNVGIGKTVNIASTYGGADVGNYNVIDQATTTASIAAAPLTVSTIDVSKVYDGTTTVFGGQAVVLSGALFGGDTLTGGTFAYTSKNVGLGNKVVVDVLTATLNDGNSGHNYAVSYVDNVNSTITPKALSVSGVTAADKVYDGTSSATVSTGGASLNGLVGGDSVTLSVTGAFANKNVGVGKTVSLTDIFGGADAGNYTITGQSSTTASITPKTLTVSQLAVADRTYDGTATATVLTGGAQYAGLVVGDSFAIASATGSFANKNAGIAKAVNISSTYSGADVGNYAVVDQASTTATISPAPLTVSTINVSKVYDGTTTVFGGHAVALSGTLFGGDTLTGGNFEYTSKNVGAGNKVVVDVLGATINDGNSGGNYAVSYVDNTNSTITPKSLGVTGITVADKVYDGTVTANINTAGAALNGLVNGDNVTVSATGAFGDKNVGAGKTIALTDIFGGTDAGNYTITGQTSTTASITPRTLTVSQLSVADRSYDGTATATVLTGGAQYTGLVVGDSVAVSATGAFANKNVGVGKSVSIASNYSGADVGNYAIVDQASTTATITAAPLTVSTVDVSKVYDGTTTVFGGHAVALSGTLFGGDTLTGGSFEYTSKNVGAGNKVVVDVLGATINDGNSGGNYAVSYVDNTNSTITPKGLSVSGITVADKVYDGTVHAAISTSGAVLGGLVSGDDVSVSATGAFGDKNVGAGKTIALTDIFGGTDAGNYTITGQTSTTASITPRTLTVSQLSVADRSYDGTAVASVVTGGAQFSGLITGDSFAIASATGSFADKNVGASKAVSISTTYSGSDLNNYNIVGQTATAASITAAPLVISTADVSKVYDGGTAATGAAAIAVGGTLFGGDVLSGGSFAYTSKNVGAGNKVVTVSGATLSDGNGGANYSVSYLDNTSSSITPKALSISGVTAADKVYDGTAAATVSSSGVVYGGLVGGDAVTLSVTGVFGDKNVGNTKTVTLADVIGGADAANYTITHQASTTASITPKTLTVSGLSVADRSYDGTATASVVTGGAQFAGMVSGDSFSIASATGSFADKNVGTAKAVSLTTSYGGSDAGNYSVVDQTGTTASISAALLTLSTANVSKTYDGTTSVTGGTGVVTAGTLFGGDSLSGGSFAYTDKNAGVGSKNVTVSGITVNDGNGGGNYLVSYVDNSASTINKAPLTISGITAANKTYDGTTAASVNAGGAVYTGLIGADSVSVTASGAFADANAGNGKTVNLSSNYSGADLGNYAITNQASTLANILQAALTVTANNDARFVTQSDGAGFNGVHFSGFVGGDTASALNLGGLNIARPNAGTDTAVGSYAGALVPSGVSALNYAISYAPGNYTILGANNALVRVANVDTGYGSTPGYTVSSVQYMNGSNVIGTLSPVSSSGNNFSYSDGAGGTLSFALSAANPVLSGSGNVSVGNYAIRDASPVISGGSLAGTVNFVGNLAVQAKAISANANGVSKVYDGTTAMSNVTLNLTGALSGDGLNVSGDGSFSQKNVGSNLSYSISGLSLGGVDAADYYLVGGSSLSGSNGSITPKSISVSGITAASKVYDGGTAATVNTSGASFNGLVSGDDVGVAATGVFADKNAGTGKTVALSSSYSGADLGNYSFTDQAGTSADITPKALSVSGLAVANRTYDGTTLATVDSSGANYAGLIGGDVVQVAATGSFADKNVGMGKTVTLNSSYSGADVGNYSIASQGSAMGEITPAAITVSAANQSKVYDGTTGITGGSAVVTGGSLFGSDALSGGSFSYATKDVGAGNKTVFASGVGVTDGNSGGNYTISYANNTSSSITPKAVTISGISAADKIYDGGTAATINGATASVNGLVSGDDVSVVATGSFGDKNAGVGKTVSLSSSYSGTDAGNYTFTDQVSTMASITPKALSVSGLAVANRAYDGTTTATVDNSGANYAGLVSGDVLHVAATGSFADKNAGAGKTVSLSSSYSGADAGNYSITSQPTALGEITPAAITVSAGNVSKIYDGGTGVSGGTATLAAGTLFGSDALSGGSFSYSDKNVGAGNKIVFVSGVGVADGNSGGNYAISYVNNSTSTITPKAISVSGIGAADKVYDGGTSATTITHTAVFSGLISGDDVAVVASGAFSDKNVGAGKTVSLSSSYSGADIGNYSFTDQATALAGITPKGLSVSGLSVANRTYDGTTVASVDTSGANFGGLISGDVVHVAASGSFVDKNAGNGKAVTLNSSYSGADVNNYTITNQANGIADIMPAAISVSTGNLSKVYDGTTTAAGTALLTSGSLFGSDALNGGSFAYTDKNVGAGNKTVQVSGVSVADGNAGGNYVISYVNNSASSITAKAVSISGVTAADKIYDGTTLATVHSDAASVNGLISGDDVEVVSTGVFGDKNAGIGKTVSLTSHYSGADAGNYSFTDQATALASITPKALSVSGLSVANRTYDGTTVASVDSSAANYAGLISGDVIHIVASGSFVNKNAGNNKAVTLNSSYSGADVNNYTITNQANGVADIMPAAISVSTGNLSKVYDGTTTAAGTALLTSGSLFGSDALNGGSFAYTDKNVGAGNKTVQVSAVSVADGNAGGNYVISYVNNSASSITAKAVSISGVTAADKVYDGTTLATVHSDAASVNGLISGDDVEVVSTGSFGDKNAGIGKTVSLTSHYSGADAGNYSFTDQATALASITPKALSVSGLSVANRTYDGTTVASVDSSAANYAGLISGDVIHIVASGSFVNKNAGNNKAVTLNSSYSGADVNNYTITNQANGVADIMPAAISVSIGNLSKVYDGTTTAAGTALLTSGSLFGSDALNGGSFAYTDKNVGAGNKTVQVSGVSVADGNAGGNYVISYVNNSASSITPKAVSISGVTAADKIYDGTTLATVHSDAASVNGLISGDDVEVVSTGSFGDKNAGTGKTVSLTSHYSGADAGNYSFTDQATTLASITPKALSISGLSVANRSYDGTTVAAVDASGVNYAGLVGGDVVQITVSGSFNNKNVGNSKPVSLSSSYSGADVGNYLITNQANGTADISPKAVTISGIAANDKVYDGTTAASLVTAPGNIVGLINGDDVQVNTSGLFNSKDVGNAKPVLLSSSYSGADAGNYSFTRQAGTLASITPKALIVSGISAADKIYDGGTSAALSIGGLNLAGLVAGDDVHLVSSNGSFADKNVGSAKTVALANAYGGTDMGNYAFTDQTGTQASITPKSLVVSGLAVADRIYDGTSAAQVITGAAQFAGLLAGDSFSIAAQGSFADKNVGTSKPVSIVSSYGGSDAGNYSVTDQSATSASITPKALTISGITAANKLYDGTTIANVSTAGVVYGGLISGDAFSVSATGMFVDPNAGLGKTVNLSSTYSGADVGNYSITGQPTASADIGKIGLLVTANADARFVSQSDSAGYNGVHYSGFVNGETPASLDTSSLLIVRPHQATDTGVGTYANALIPSGISSDNYAVSFAAGSYTILGVNNALVKLANTSTTYGNAASFTPASVQYMDGNHVIGNLTQVASSGNSFTYSDGSGGTLQFTLSPQNPTLSGSGNLSVGNYAVQDASPIIGGGSLQGAVTFTGNLAVQARGVNASATGVSKVYDGSLLAPTLALGVNGTLSGDSLSISGNASFLQKNVGTHLTYSVNGLLLSGADSADYYISGGNSFTGNNGSITPKAVSVSGISAADKIYDGSTIATVNTGAASISGLVSGDDVSVNASGTFSDKNVGLGKTISLSSSYSGLDSGNYTFTDQASTTADITPKALNVSGLSVANRSYDGTALATVDTSHVNYAGLVGGDVIQLAANGSFSDKNAGLNKLVSLSSSYSGADVGNYTITDQGSTHADISAAAITVSSGNASKIYDGTTGAAGSALLTAGTLFGSDVLSGGSFAYADKNVGTGNKILRVSDVQVLDGNAGGNYAITYADNSTSTIAPKAVSVAGITAANKVYDGTVAATINTAAASLYGLVAGDEVSLLATGAFSDKNAGTGKTIALASSYGGADAGNYVFTDQAGTTADITPKALSVSANNAQASVTGRPYNGGNGVSYAGFVAGEDAGVLSGLLSYGGSSQGAINAGSYTITPQGLSSGNYAISFVNGTLTLGASLAPPPPFAPIRGVGLFLRSFVFAGDSFSGGLAGLSGDFNGLSNSVGLRDDSIMLADAGMSNPGNNSTSGDMPSTGDKPIELASGQDSNQNKDNAANADGRERDERAFGDTIISMIRQPDQSGDGLMLVLIRYTEESGTTSFSFPLPEHLLQGLPRDVKVEARLHNGNPLPRWLHYDSNAHAFVAKIVPKGALPLQVVVTIKGLNTTIAIMEQSKRY